MSIYIDASVLVALFTDEPLTDRAVDFVKGNSPVLVVSDFAAAEFASAIVRRVRMRQVTADEARDLLSTFDAWLASGIVRAQTTAADVASADAFLRRLDLGIRTPDALNIAIAQRIDAELLSFDRQMAAEAKTLGINVIVI